MPDYTLVQPACTCSCHTPPTPTPVMKPTDCVQTSPSVTVAMAEAARLQADVARLQAEAILALIQRGNTAPTSPSNRYPPALTQRQPTAADLPEGMLISGSVGSISVADWEAMSETRLRGLDSALSLIVETALLPGVTWNTVGEIIQGELAAAGFVFNTACDSTKYTEQGGGKESEDQSLSDIVRMRAAARGTKEALGASMWVDEMVRIALRLMELRGM